MPEPDRLRAFMNGFYGYGTWDANLWFVGMEEGGGGTLEEVERRVNAWSGAELEDLRDFHVAAGMPQLFGDRPRIQSTWGKLSRIALCAEGRSADAESARCYQRDELGRFDGATALVELLPLPSPSTRHWIYTDSGIPEIATRESYREFMTARRIDEIRSRIDQHQPRAIVFYGLAYREHWMEIAGSPFQRVGGTPLERASRVTTLLFLIPHPVARGAGLADFCRIGKVIYESYL